MKDYVKPIILANNDLSEGVYTASGTIDNGPKCDSQYMDGKPQKPDYTSLRDSSTWGKGYKELCGCLGCPAFIYGSCNLTLGIAYNRDFLDGQRKPVWEKLNKKPDDPIESFVNWMSESYFDN